MEHNIVFIGASFAALPAAHALLSTILPKLSSTSISSEKQKQYKVTIISTSPDFYWKIGSPRTIVDPSALPVNRIVLPIAPEFKKYGADRFEFVHSSAESIDHGARTIVLGNGGTIRYDTLVIASGTSFVNPIWSVAGPDGSKATVAALKDIHARLPSARSILVAGGGAAGVETAGELGFKYGKDKGKEITILSGASQLLHRLDNKRVGAAAQRRLESMGVKVRNNGLQVRKSTRQANGQELLELSDGTSLTVDLFIEATGDRPNSKFVPKEWLNDRGYVRTEEKTLRLDVPGVRDVYCLGSVASFSDGSIADSMFTQAALIESIRLDLLERAGTPPAAKRKIYYSKFKSQFQIIPIGPKGGVGVVFGWQVPSFMVWMIKSRDFMIGNAAKTVKGG